MMTAGYPEILHARSPQNEPPTSRCWGVGTFPAVGIEKPITKFCAAAQGAKEHILFQFRPTAKERPRNIGNESPRKREAHESLRANPLPGATYYLLDCGKCTSDVLA